MENKEIVFKVLKDTDVPLKAGEIAGKTGLDKKEVDRAMKILKTENLIESPKRCFWQAR